MGCRCGCGCSRRCRRRRKRCCRRGVRIPRALVLGIVFALAANNLKSLLSPVSNVNNNIININSDNYEPEEGHCKCYKECNNNYSRRCKC